MSVYYLTESNRYNKKYAVKTPWGRTIHFGAKNLPDYTDHKLKESRDLWILNHKRRDSEKWNDFRNPEFWVRWVMYEKPDLREALSALANDQSVDIRIE